MSAFKWVFCDLRVLVRKLACPFGYPTSLPKFNLALLVSPFCQGFRTVFVNSVNKEYTSNSVYLHALNERKIHSVQIKIIWGDLEWCLNTIFSPRHPIFLNSTA